MSDFASLADRLIDACVASCSCFTKSPGVEHHDPMCHFRLFDEAHRAVVRLNNCESKLASSKKNLDDYRSISDEMINERAMLVREIVAWFDVMHSKYVSDGTPVELSEEWPSDWMRRAREILE